MISTISNVLHSVTSCCTKRAKTPQEHKTHTVAKACIFDTGSLVIAKQRVWSNRSFHVLADYAPLAKGHLLLVPKRHFVKAQDMNKTEAEDEVLLRQNIVKVYAKLFNIKENEVEYIELRKNGPMAGQSVPHCHLHIVPIRKGTFFAQMNILWRFFFGHKKDPDLAGTVHRFKAIFQTVFRERATS